MTLKIAGLNVAICIGYLPDSLPVRIEGGILTTDLAIDSHSRLVALRCSISTAAWLLSTPS